jgi:hypothetical protein
VGHLALVGTIGSDDEEIPAAVATGIEQDPPAVGRPRGVGVTYIVERQPAFPGAVDVDHVKLRGPMAFALEDDLPPVRRPRGVDVEERRKRRGWRLARDGRGHERKQARRHRLFGWRFMKSPV